MVKLNRHGPPRLGKPRIDGMNLKLAYTFEEAAEMVGYSAQVLRRAAADGLLIVRYGSSSKPVIRHSELEAWLDSLPTEPPTTKPKSRTPDHPQKPDPEPAPMTRQARAPQAPLTERESEWLTPEDVGNMLQISAGTIANWRTTKKGPDFVRIGGLVRYKRDAVAAWIEAQPTN